MDLLMSHRGTTIDAAEHRWQRYQYADGVEDGLQGRHGSCSDRYYQEGYRRGCARRKRKQVECGKVDSG